MKKLNKKILAKERDQLIDILDDRFKNNMPRHKEILWADVLAKIKSNPEKLWSLNEMEKTGGEPDVIAFDTKSGEIIFCDCSKETPEGRRNVCYDRIGQDAREKEGIQMAGNAVDMADTMGIELLTEDQYRDLQKLGEFDTKTSSWLKTPLDIRKAGGAIFADRRYGHVFVYHNSAQSFYRVRGFRGLLKV